MRNALIFLGIAAFLFLMFSINSTAHADKWEDLIIESSKVVDEINSAPDAAIPKDLLKGCKAVAIFPSTVGGGFIIGAKYGQGVIVCRNGYSWSPPAVFNISGASIGWQIGGQASDIALLIMNKRGLDGLIQSKLTLGGDASVAAGPVGREAQVGMDLQLKGGIFSYSRSRGAFAGLRLEAAVISQNEQANKALYKGNFSAEEILREEKVRSTPAGSVPIRTLNKYCR
ncbi:MAG: lipid-binding SYLF domain-containing protein [Candidatus Omnitrophota bacterium]